MNFKKHFAEYEKYSIIQRKVAINLVDYMKKNKIFSKDIFSVFEIGCGTGIFTRAYQKEIESIYSKKLILNDKFEVKDFLKNITYTDLMIGDIQEIDIPKSDLILSSSVFQWIDDLEELFNKISNSTNKLCFSMYISGNLIEIKNHFGISLKYKTADEIKEIAEKYFPKISFYKESIKLDFENPIEVLKHLKYTGVTGLQKPSVANIRTFENKSLTYEVAYFICEK